MTGRIVMSSDDRPYTPSKKHLAKNLTNRMLKGRLCEAGPALCEKCKACTYGREYLIRGLPVEGVQIHG